MTNKTLALLLLVGCGTDPDPVVTPDASPDSPGPAACNSLELVDRDVPEIQAAEDVPMPTGGTIVPGRYLLTSATIYTGAGGATGPNGDVLRAYTVNDGSAYDFVQRDAAGVTSRTSGTYTIEGTSATITNDCPGGDPNQFGLITTPSSFTLLAGSNALQFTRL